jgi:N-methylhydantoinase A
VDVRNDEVQTAVARHADLDVAAVAATLADLEARAARSLDAEGFARREQRYRRSADLRYFGQAFEVRVQVPDGPVDPALTDATVAAFHDAHQRLYGYSFRDDPTQQVEWVNLRVTGIGPIRRPTLTPIGEAAGEGVREGASEGAPHPNPLNAGAPAREGNPAPGSKPRVVHSPTSTSASTPSPTSSLARPSASTSAPSGSRPACFDPSHGFVDTAIYQRGDLGPGHAVEGPAVIEEYGATVPLAPGFRAEVDRFGNLTVTRSGAAAAGRPEEGAAP